MSQLNTTESSFTDTLLGQQEPDNATFSTSRSEDDIMSQQTSEQIIFALECIVFPIVTVFGVTGNILSLIVLLQKRLYSSTVILLIGLTIADGLFLVANYLRKAPCIIEKFNPDFANLYYARTSSALFYIKTTFSRVSTLHVVAISIERFIAVAFPLKTRYIVTKSKMIFVVVALYLYTFAALFPLCLQSKTIEVGGHYYAMHSDFYLQNIEIMQLYNSYITPIIFRWIPKVLVISFNTTIIWNLVRRTSNFQTVPRQFRKQRRITKMLLVVAIVFVVCLLPGDAFQIAYTVVDEFSFRGKNRYSYFAFSDLSVLFDMINSSVNFIIYMALSETFSAVYVALFCPCLKHDSEGIGRDRIINTTRELSYKGTATESSFTDTISTLSYILQIQQPSTSNISSGDIIPKENSSVVANYQTDI